MIISSRAKVVVAVVNQPLDEQGISLAQKDESSMDSSRNPKACSLDSNPMEIVVRKRRLFMYVSQELSLCYQY